MNGRKKRLRPLHWEPIQISNLESTIWGQLKESPSKSARTDVNFISNLQEDKENSMNMSHINESTMPTPRGKKHIILNEEEIQSLFSLSPLKEKATNGQQNVSQTPYKTVKKQTSVALLPVNRANNIGITLSQFKGVEWNQIREAILKMDESRISIDNLKALRSALIPISEKEIRDLKEFKGDILTLSKPERFLIELLKIDRLVTKVEIFLFKAQFGHLLQDITFMVNAIQEATVELRQCTKFFQILKTILDLGEVLNRDTHLKSYGFKLESLNKLAETKTKHKNATLLHYLAYVVRNQDPDLLQFANDLPSLQLATKYSLEAIKSEMKIVSAGLANVKAEVAACNEDAQIHSNLVTEESAAFRCQITEFYEDSKAKFTAISNHFQEASNQFRDLCAYFGQTNTNNGVETLPCVSEFFLIIYNFSIGVIKADRENSIEGIKKNNDQHSEKRTTTRRISNVRQI